MVPQLSCYIMTPHRFKKNCGRLFLPFGLDRCTGVVLLHLQAAALQELKSRVRSPNLARHCRVTLRINRAWLLMHDIKLHVSRMSKIR